MYQRDKLRPEINARLVLEAYKEAIARRFGILKAIDGEYRYRNGWYILRSPIGLLKTQHAEVVLAGAEMIGDLALDMRVWGDYGVRISWSRYRMPVKAEGLEELEEVAA